MSLCMRFDMASSSKVAINFRPVQLASTTCMQYLSNEAAASHHDAHVLVTGNALIPEILSVLAHEIRRVLQELGLHNLLTSPSGKLIVQYDLQAM